MTYLYSFALASIFLCGRTYLPILPHLVCRLNGGYERLSERHPKMRKRSETHTNFLYALSCVCSRVLYPMSVGGRWHRKGISVGTMMPGTCPYTLLYIGAYALPYYIYRALWPGVIFRSALPSPSSVSAHDSQDLPCLFGKMPS